MPSNANKADSSTAVSRDEFDAVVVALLNENTELKRQLDWFERQVFGNKSEN